MKSEQETYSETYVYDLGTGEYKTTYTTTNTIIEVTINTDTEQPENTPVEKNDCPTVEKFERSKAIRVWTSISVAIITLALAVVMLVLSVHNDGIGEWFGFGIFAFISLCCFSSAIKLANMTGYEIWKEKKERQELAQKQAQEQAQTKSKRKSKSSCGLLGGLLLFPFAFIGAVGKKGERFYAFNDKKYKSRKSKKH